MASNLKTAIESIVYKGAPIELSKRFRVLNDRDAVLLKDMLEESAAKGNGPALAPEELNEHLVKRIAKFRNKVVPWIHHFLSLENATG